jgi:hypothetical protein
VAILPLASTVPQTILVEPLMIQMVSQIVVLFFWHILSR